MKLIQQSIFFLILGLIPFLSSGQTLEYFSNHDDINELFFDEDRIWVATSGGLLEVDFNGILLQKHTVLNGINAPKIEHVVRDDEGDLYIETNANRDAIQIYKEGRWENYSGFQENNYIDLVTSNGLFGYLHRSESSIHLKNNKKWTAYKTGLDGFKLNNVLILDDENNLWASCDNGLVKHNGKSHKTYSFLSKYERIRTLLKDKKGGLWALSNRTSWYRYDKKKDAWLPCESEGCQLISKGRFSFSDSKGNLWFANQTADSLYKYDGSKWKGIAVPVRDVPKSIDNEEGKDWLFTGAEDKAGNLWFGTPFGNLYKYDGKTWQFFDLSEKDYLIKNSNFMSLTSIIEDKDQNIWISGSDFIAFHDVEENKHKFFLRDDFEGNFQFTYMSADAIVEDGEGSIYVNPQEGIFKYNRKQDDWDYIMTTHDVAFMHYDKRNDAMSFLSDKGKLITKDSKGSTSYQQVAEDKDGNGYIMYKAVLWDSKGGFWLSVNDELYYSNTENTVMTFDANNSPIDIEPNVIYEDSKGQIWVNVKNGVAYWDGKTWTSFTNKNTLLEDLPSNRKSKVLSITEDKNGNVFVRGSNSIFSWDGKQWIGQRKWNDCLTGSYNGSLFFDSNNVMWLFNNRQSIFKCDGVDCVSIVDNFDAECIDVLEDRKGRIWILTRFGGIFRYSEK